MEESGDGAPKTLCVIFLGSFIEIAKLLDGNIEMYGNCTNPLFSKTNTLQGLKQNRLDQYQSALDARLFKFHVFHMS